jgi:hypothetical protein
MRLLALVLTYILCLNAFAVGPLGVTGQNQNPAKFPSVIKAPNNQVTDIGSSSVLVETGNQNLLANPSFEHSTVTTGWTSSTVTPAASTTTVIHGKKALCFTASSQAFTLSQDSTLYASQFADGVQGLAYIRLKTNHTGAITVCSNNAGAASTSNCVTAQASNTWGLYKLPFILGATSNGITVSAASGSGTTCVDDAFVGAVDLKLDSSVVGPWVDYGAQTVGAVTTAPTKGTVVTDKVRCRISGQDYECEFNYAQSSAGTAGSGEYIFSLPSGISMDSSRIAFTTATLGNVDTYTHQTSVMNTVGKINTGTARGDVTAYAYSATQFRLQTGIAYTGYSAQSSTQYALSNATESWKFTIKFPGLGLSSNFNSYSSTNANYSRVAYTPTFTGLGTTSSVDCGHSRTGQYLDVDCKWTSATATATEARVSLPTVNGIALTPAISSIRVMGTAGISAVGDQAISVLAEPSNNYVTFGFQGASGAALTKQTGSGWIGTGTVTAAFTARIPISQWDNSNVTIAQFSEVMTTPGVVKPKACYFSFGGASASVATPTECTAASCVEVEDTCNMVASAPVRNSAGDYTFTVANGTFAPNTIWQIDSTGYSATNQVRECHQYNDTVNRTWSANSSGGGGVRFWCGSVVGGALDGAIRIRIEGQAP